MEENKECFSRCYAYLYLRKLIEDNNGEGNATDQMYQMLFVGVFLLIFLSK